MSSQFGPLARLIGELAGSFAGAARGRTQGREPRVVLYDAAGSPNALLPDAAEHEQIVEVAERMIDLVADRPPSRASDQAERR